MTETDNPTPPESDLALLTEIIRVLREVHTQLPDKDVDGSNDKVSAEQIVQLLAKLEPRAEFQEYRFVLPTYYPDSQVGEQEFRDPYKPVVVYDADGLKIVLGSHDRHDVSVPDIQVERRYGGWVVFLHPEPGGDAAGFVYILDDGQCIIQPELRSELRMVEHDDPIKGLDRPKPEEPKPSHWDDDAEYPVKDWQYEVANGDTRQSYREWVEDRKKQALDLDEEETK